MAVSYLFGVILRSCLLSADRAPGQCAGSKEYVSPRGFRRGLALLSIITRLRVPARHGLVETEPDDVGERLAGGGDPRVERPPELGSREGQDVCLLYTSDAADDLLCVDLGGRRIIKKKKKNAK